MINYDKKIIQEGEGYVLYSPIGKAGLRILEAKEGFKIFSSDNSKKLDKVYLSPYDSIDNYYDLKEESNISLKLECEEVIIKMTKILSDDMFKVIIMRLINELEYKEISKLINKKESTVRWLYMEGIKKVKEELYVR